MLYHRKVNRNLIFKERLGYLYILQNSKIVFPGGGQGIMLTCIYLRVCSLHNLLTQSRSSSTDQDISTPAASQSNVQPKPPPHQKPPPPRHAMSEGGSHGRFYRSDSAPPQRSQPVMPVESLVVNLNQGRNIAANRNVAEGPSERSRFAPTLPLPPPPAPKSV